MIRFKVIRASRLLLFAAILLLVIVPCAIVARLALAKPPAAAGANLVQSTLEEGAETLSVFALRLRAAQAPTEMPPDGIEVEVMRPSEAPSPTPSPRPSVLIYHTHTHEAYDPVSDDPYDAVEAWRTTDNGHSVVRVGQELTQDLAALGFEVVHDTTDHEGDALSTAYTRSLKTLEAYDRKFDLYIDLHRDAWLEGMPMRYLSEDGTACAQPMLLIGNGNGFDEKPFYRENLAFAQALTERVNRDHPGLCKDVLVKDGRYNQHIGVFAVLIEVGHNKNTLKEALNAVPAIANGIRDVFEHPGDALAEIMEKRR